MIDAHIHIFPSYRRIKAIRWIKKYIPGLVINEAIEETEILDKLRSLNISYFFNYIYPLRPEESISLNKYNNQLAKRVKNAICFGSVHPDNTDRIKIIEEAIIDFDLIGLKFHPFVQGFKILDKRMEDVYQIMQELGRPIVFHTGFEYFYKAKMSPDEIELILKKYPKLVIVISHMFYPHIDKAFHLLEKYENIYLDGTNIFSNYRESINGENVFEGMLTKKNGEYYYEVCFNYSIFELEKYSHRIMFGSDFPVAMNNLDNIYEYIKNIDISESAKKNILENTAKNFIRRFKPDFFDERGE